MALEACRDEKRAAAAGSSSWEWNAWLKKTREVAKVRRRDRGTGLRMAQRRPELADGINRDCIGSYGQFRSAVVECMNTYSHGAHRLKTKYDTKDLGSSNRRKWPDFRQMSSRIYGDDSWRSSLAGGFKECKHLSRACDGSADVGYISGV